MRRDQSYLLYLILALSVCVSYRYSAVVPLLEPDITHTLVETTCKPDGTYDLKVEIEYSSTTSNAFAVNLNGDWIDTIAYADFARGDTLCISGLMGDGGTGIELFSVDTAIYNALNVHPIFSEWHYENDGEDVNEIIEITGPAGTDLSEYQIVVYEDGNDMDDSDVLSGMLLGSLGSCGVDTFNRADLGGQYFENDLDAIALVHIATGEVVDFISVEGTISATTGPAVGLTSENIGTEPTSTHPDSSLQLTDMGWTGPITNTAGMLNDDLTCPFSVPSACIDTLRYDAPLCVVCMTDITGSDASICRGDSMLLSDLISGTIQGALYYGETFGSPTDTITTYAKPIGTTTYYIVDSVSAICSDTAQVTITVLEQSMTMLSQSICAGDSLLFDGDYLTTGGTYLDTLMNAAGCDSIIELTLMVDPLPVLSALDTTICAGDVLDLTTYESEITSESGSFSYSMRTLEPLADLFISEYVEGSSFNKCLEIYNGTGVAVDLSDYSIDIYTNGSTSISTSIGLVGMLAHDDVHVLCHTSATPPSDQQNGGVNFNGDDAIVLSKSGAVIDVIGQVGFDPGGQWGSGLTSTADNTLVRMPSVLRGDTDGTDAFDPSVEWIGYARDDFSHLGSHDTDLFYNKMPIADPTDVTYGDSVEICAVFTSAATMCVDSAMIKVVTQDTSMTVLDREICSGDSILFGGDYYDAAGTYRDTLTNAAGCDSIIELRLSILDLLVLMPVDTTICAGDRLDLTAYYSEITSDAGTFSYNDPRITDATDVSIMDSISVYVIFTDAMTMCRDSVLIRVIELDTARTMLSQSICAGDSLLFDGDYLATGGTYLDTLMNVAGCDSIIELTLTIDPLPVLAPLDTTICAGDVLDLTSYESEITSESGSFSYSVRTLEPLADLFISEYVEGSSLNKCLEIYNGTGASVDLSTYSIDIYKSGSTTIDESIGLVGILAHDDVHVLCHTSATPPSDQQDGDMTYNGDDAIVLSKSGAVIDVIGQVGFDPGGQWGSGLISTADNTIIRMPSVLMGDTDGTDAFDPSVEWIGYAQDDFSHLGSHDADLVYTKMPISNPTDVTYGDSVEIVAVFTAATTMCVDSTTIKVVMLDTALVLMDSLLCMGDSILFDGDYIKTDGVYRDTVALPNGCDSITILTVTTLDCTAPDVALTKAIASPIRTHYDVGDTITFDITVYNQGSVSLYDIVIKEYIPDGFAFDASLNDSRWDGDTTFVAVSSLMGFTDTTIAVTLSIDSDDTPILTNAAEVVHASLTPGGPPIVDEDSDLAILGGDAERDDNVDDLRVTGSADVDVDQDDYDFVRVPLCSALSYSQPATQSPIVYCDSDYSEPTTITPMAVFRPTDLFFSEYIEGPSGQNNKCLEIYNGTDTDIDLSQYSIELYNTGQRINPNRTLSLSGTVAAGDVYVICNNSSFSSEVDLVDINNVMIYNGDDVIILRKGGRVIDVIGRRGEDPGARWGTISGVSTADQTLRRKSSIIAGDDLDTDTFLPSDEWISLGRDSNDPSGLGSHTVDVVSVGSFSFYDGDPDAGGQLLASQVATYDTLVTETNSPTSIWVTTHPAGSSCESAAEEVTIYVHPDETSSMNCGANLNVTLDENCQIGDIISSAYRGELDPVFLEMTYSTHDGQPVREDDLSNYIGSHVKYAVMDTCTGRSCWGLLHIEAKALPERIHSAADTICCSEDWTQAVSMSLSQVEQTLDQRCYAAHSDLAESVEQISILCDTLTYIIEYSADFFIHKKVEKCLLYTDTVVVLPLHIDSVRSPGSMNHLDSLALADTIVIAGCADFDPTPDNVMAYWANILDPGDRAKNGDNEGVPYAYPYVQKDSIIVRDTSIIIRDKDVIIKDQLVLIDGVWTVTDVIDHQKDTATSVRVDTVAVYLPLVDGTGCNIQATYSDHIKPSKCYADGKVLRTWSLVDWCHGRKEERQQWIIVEDQVKPDFGVFPTNFVLLGLDSIIINNDTVALRDLADRIDVDEIIQIDYTDEPYRCVGKTRIPRFDNFFENCTPYDSMEFSYTFDQVGPYADSLDQFLIHDLPFGVNEIMIHAKDQCGNEAVPHRFFVVMLDGAPPTPICKDTIRVTLIDDYRIALGINRIPISAFDHATTDACGGILLTLAQREDFKFRCGDSSLTFVGTEYLEFCCEDINQPVSVSLTYFDFFGNTSKCWSTIIVEDKQQKQISCGTLELECYETPTKEQLLDAISLRGSVCDGSEVVTYIPPKGPDACGGGSEYVEILVDGVPQCAVHVIYGGATAFDPYSIKWPIHRDGRSSEGIRRECLTRADSTWIIDFAEERIAHHDAYTCTLDEELTDAPVWCATDCGLVLPSYTIDTSLASESCRSLIKRWSIIDWCLYKPNEADHQLSSDTYEVIDDTWLDAGDSDRAGMWYSDSRLDSTGCVTCHKPTAAADHVYVRYSQVAVDGFYSYEQIIHITDDIAPQIALQDTTLHACQSEQYLTASASDVCIAGDSISSSHISWWVEYSTIIDGKISQPIQTSSGVGESYSIPMVEARPGEQIWVQWSARDLCGNTATAEQIYTYRDTIAPVPLCLTDVSTVFMENGMIGVAIWAADVDKGSYDDCDDQIYVEIAPVMELDRRGYNTLLNCGNVMNDTVEMRLYARDLSGNEDYCTFYLHIPDDPCDLHVAGSLGGQVVRMDDTPVEGATVAITNADSTIVTAASSTAGHYLADIPSDVSSFMVSAAKDDEHLYGLSTLDILLIQRHILGLSELSTMADRIAADVNGDGQITARDLVQLRSLLLGRIDELPDQDSWMVMPQEYMSDDMTYPYELMMPRSTDMFVKQDFYAIKIGDVSGSHAQTRSARPLELQLRAGAGGRVDVYSAEDETLTGMSITLPLSSLSRVVDGQLDMSGSYHVSNDGLKIEWINARGQQIDHQQPLFSIMTEASELDLSAIAHGTDVVINGEMDTRPIKYVHAQQQEQFILYQNSPNPFSKETTISYYLPADASVDYRLWSADGQMIHQARLEQSAGRQQIVVQRSEQMTAGVYMYQIIVGGRAHTGRMIVID